MFTDGINIISLNIGLGYAQGITARQFVETFVGEELFCLPGSDLSPCSNAETQMGNMADDRRGGGSAKSPP